MTLGLSQYQSSESVHIQVETFARVIMTSILGSWLYRTVRSGTPRLLDVLLGQLRKASPGRVTLLRGVTSWMLCPSHQYASPWYVSSHFDLIFALLAA